MEELNTYILDTSTFGVKMWDKTSFIVNNYEITWNDINNMFINIDNNISITIPATVKKDGIELEKIIKEDV